MALPYYLTRPKPPLENLVKKSLVSPKKPIVKKKVLPRVTSFIDKATNRLNTPMAIQNTDIAIKRIADPIAAFREKSGLLLNKFAPRTPEEALGQGLLPLKKKDGTFSYIDLTGSGTIKTVRNEAAMAGKGLIKRGLASISERLVGKSLEARTQLIDRYAPISDFIKGKKMPTEADPYIAARNFAGRFGKIQNRLSELSDIITPARKVLDPIKEYSKLERFEELAGRGITKFEGDLTLEQIVSNKSLLEKKLGSKKLTEVKTAIEQIRAYSDRLLTEAKEAGIVSQESFDAIRKNNQKYIPLQRLEYLADQGDNLPRGANSFSVATQDLVKKIQGSNKEVADPIESLVRNTYKTVNLIERNKVAQKVAALADLDEFKEVVIPLQKKASSIVKPLTKAEGGIPSYLNDTTPVAEDISKDVPKGMDKLSVFKNGIKEEYAIPKELADALKGLNEKNMDIVTRLAGRLGGLLRAGATSLNIGFLPSNAIRDFQTATLVSKVGFTPWDWLKGFAEAVKRGPDYERYLESGASFSGFFEQTKQLSKTTKQLSEPKGLKLAKTILNPIKLMQTVGETIELAPRLGVFKRSLKKGKPLVEAAFNAREATVDFAKSGSVMKVANLWIPFLNARTQGTWNVLKAVGSRPVRSALIIGAVVETPVVATYYHNTTFHKEIWEDIAQFEKDNNFIIIYGDGKDKDENPTQVVKIPKGDVGRIFGNPAENFLEYLDKSDPKSIGQVIIEMFGNISPVGGVREGKISPVDILSNTSPPTVKGGVEGATNTNLFTGRKIVPRSLEDASPEQQYTEKTSPIAVKLGQFLGVSPMLIENFIGTQFGGLGRQLINPGTAGEQVSGRFVGARGGEGENKDFDTLDQLKTEDVDSRLISERKAKELLETLRNLPINQRKERVADLMLGGEINAEVLVELGQVIESEAKGFTSFERVFKSQPNEVKAKFLIDKLKTLPVDERREYFQNLAVKGLITENLLKQITKEIKDLSK